MNSTNRWRRLAATVVSTAAAIGGLQLATTAPAHAGQVGLTIDIGGRGWVEVVEGAGADQPKTCRNETALSERDTISCARVRGESAFAATLWLRAHPGVGEERGEWIFGGWKNMSGCDQVRNRDGWQECGVTSGSFSSDERSLNVRFLDTVAPPAPKVTVTTLASAERTVRYTVSNAASATTNECTIDNKLATYCNDGIMQLTEGEHVFRGYSTDPTGNRSESTEVPFLVVDTAVVSGPPAVSSSRTAEFKVSSGVGTRFVCSLETFPEPVGCASGSTSGTIRFSNLSEGQHTLTVAAEKDGWKDAVPATYTWSVDATGPTTRIQYDNSVDNADVRVAVSASETSTSECRVYREGTVPGAWKPCLQNINRFPGLTDGTYVFEARSTDEAGNIGPVASYRHVVDLNGPEVTLRPTVSGHDASIAIDAPGAQRLLCRETHLGVQDPSFHRCPTPVVMTGLAPGEHSLEVRGYDAYNNWNLPGATYTWQVRDAEPDRGAPDTRLAGGPAEGTIVTSTSATLSATADEAATFSCVLDEAPVACPGGQVSLSGLGAGRHTLKVTAVDSAGNRDASPATRSWSVPAGSRALAPGRGKAKGFRQVASASAFGGAEAVAKRKGATLTASVTQARTIAVIAAPGKGQGKVAVRVGGRRIGTLNLGRGSKATTVLTLPALGSPYSGPVSITSLTGKPVRIQGLGWF